jgi:anti-sigma factor RsiW
MKGAHPPDEQLIAYVLEDLETPDRSTVTTHLRGCDACRRVVTQLTAALESYRSATETDAPADILVDLLEVQAETQARPRAWTWWRVPAAAAAGIIVLGGLFLSGFWAGQRTASPTAYSVAADSLVTMQRPLPEPPQIPFQTAAVPETIR